MTEQERRKGGGGKLARSETVTVRLDPKLRYLADLAARKQRRTLSSYIEWAMEDSLSRITLHEDGNHRLITLGEEAPNLWDVDDSDRFAKLALRYPDLLTHEEQVRWKNIRECGYLWRGAFSKSHPYEWKWDVEEGSLCFERLRDHWNAFAAVARGEAPTSTLPTWTKVDPNPKKPTGIASVANMDDDIPF
jgi:hypothetical protein